MSMSIAAAAIAAMSEREYVTGYCRLCGEELGLEVQPTRVQSSPVQSDSDWLARGTCPACGLENYRYSGSLEHEMYLLRKLPPQ